MARRTEAGARRSDRGVRGVGLRRARARRAPQARGPPALAPRLHGRERSEADLRRSELEPTLLPAAGRRRVVQDPRAGRRDPPPLALDRRSLVALRLLPEPEAEPGALVRDASGSGPGSRPSRLSRAPSYNAALFRSIPSRQVHATFSPPYPCSLIDEK